MPGHFQRLDHGWRNAVVRGVQLGEDLRRRRNQAALARNAAHGGSPGNRKGALPGERCARALHQTGLCLSQGQTDTGGRALVEIGQLGGVRRLILSKQPAIIECARDRSFVIMPDARQDLVAHLRRQPDQTDWGRAPTGGSEKDALTMDLTPRPPLELTHSMAHHRSRLL